MSNFENSAQSIGAFSQADDLKKRIIYTLFILVISKFFFLKDLQFVEKGH